MSTKNKIIITAIITFVVTALLFVFVLGGSVIMSLSSFANDGMQKIGKIDALIDAYYIYDYDKEKMTDLSLAAYTYGLGDPYTSYIDKESFADMKQSVEGDYVGIGIEVFIDSDMLITVISPFDHSPAAEAGILPGDKIIKVGDTNVDYSNYTEAINLIKGDGKTEDGKTVNLTIKRGEEVFDVSVARKKVVAITAQGKMLTDGIGYIRISSFGEKTGEEFKESLRALRTQQITSLVIDLRNNPGGTLDSLVDVADVLMPKGNIITIKDKQGNETKYDSDARCVDFPICVLINGNSASAAEALAGALADSGMGVLVGEKTFGKGSVQSIFELGDGTAFKVTAAKYYTPGGTCIDKTGITPAHEVALDEDVKNVPVNSIPYEKDSQLKKAVEILEKNN